MPGALRVAAVTDDPGLIAEWTSDELGSAAYDFYAEALPATGFPIVGLYPGGDVAVIRFRVRDGAIWQMVAHGRGAGIATIQIRLDRP